MPHSDPETKKPLPKNAKKSVPWWDPECQEAKNRKIQARNTWQAAKTIENLDTYKRMRNQSIKIITDKKKKVF